MIFNELNHREIKTDQIEYQEENKEVEVSNMSEDSYQPCCLFEDIKRLVQDCISDINNCPIALNGKIIKISILCFLEEVKRISDIFNNTFEPHRKDKRIIREAIEQIHTIRRNLEDENLPIDNYIKLLEYALITNTHQYHVLISYLSGKLYENRENDSSLNSLHNAQSHKICKNEANQLFVEIKERLSSLQYTAPVRGDDELPDGGRRLEDNHEYPDVRL